MSVIYTPRKPELEPRVLIFPLSMVGLLGVLFFRLWYVQVVKAPVLIERAEATQKMAVSKMAPRGLIFDRQGEAVAGIRPQVVITAKPSEVKKNPWVIEKVAGILGVPVKKLQRKLNEAQWRPFLASPIYVGASIEAGARIAESGDDLPGIGVETLPMRFYPDTRSFTHVLGYVWSPSPEDITRIEKAGKEPADYVGKTGIERAFEPDLMGSPGAEEMEVDARRRPIRIAGRDEPVPGNQLYLTLDGRLQRLATQLLNEHNYIGAVAAVDPQTGEVLCLVSSPTFDQKIFEGGLSQTEWDQINGSETKPMYNRALLSAYPPGSTFKIVTTIAAMETGKFNPNMTFNCPGGYFRRGVKLKCLGVHGNISFARAMADSCNTYFCNLGAYVGEDAIRKVAVEMGLGVRPELEIGGGAGVVPTRKWIELVAPDHKYHWYAGDTANLSVGQGYMNTTPIQMANLMAMTSMNGVRYKPHLVRAVKDSTTGQLRHIEPELANKIEGTEEFWSTLKSALYGVVEHGTAANAKVPGITIAGKTGSAEHQKGEKTHGWFVGYAPVDHPKIAICVLVEAAGHGGVVAAPLAGRLIQRYLSSAPEKVAASASAASASADLPARR